MGVNLSFDYENSGRWVELEKDVRLKIRFLPGHKNRYFIRKHTRRSEDGSGTMDLDEETYARDVFDWAVTDWEGIEVDRGNGPEKAELTRENKIRLMDLFNEILSLVLRYALDGKQFHSDREELQKN